MSHGLIIANLGFAGYDSLQIIGQLYSLC